MKSLRRRSQEERLYLPITPYLPDARAEKQEMKFTRASRLTEGDRSLRLLTQSFVQPVRYHIIRRLRPKRLGK
jgi:hypothetical protein